MYKVLIDYGSEGYCFMDGEFETINQAVKEVMTYTQNKFLIVKIIDWEAKETDCSSDIIFPSMEIKDTKIIKVPSGKC